MRVQMKSVEDNKHGETETGDDKSAECRELPDQAVNNERPYGENDWRPQDNRGGDKLQEFKPAGEHSSARWVIIHSVYLPGAALNAGNL